MPFGQRQAGNVGAPGSLPPQLLSVQTGLKGTQVRAVPGFSCLGLHVPHLFLQSTPNVYQIGPNNIS